MIHHTSDIRLIYLIIECIIRNDTYDFSSKYVDAEYDSGIVLKGNNGTCVIIGENDFYFDFDDLDYVSWEEQQYDMKKILFVENYDEKTCDSDYPTFCDSEELYHKLTLWLKYSQAE